MEKCAFCGKKISEVPKMAKSRVRDSVYICKNCAWTANHLLSGSRWFFGDYSLDRWEGDRQEAARKWEGPRMDMVDGPSGMAAGSSGMTPRQIHRELDRFVIGQEAAKKVLSVAVYNHHKRLHDKSGLIKKSNILLAGPSGCGKTLLARTLAGVLDVPFAAMDTTSMTQAGYVGDDVEVCLQRLVEAAGGDIRRAQQGIIYLDEIDKTARHGRGRGVTKDVSGEGVQSSLLKLIEGCEVTVPANGSKKHPAGQTALFDTSDVLFICGGAFEGLFGEPGARRAGFGAPDGPGDAGTGGGAGGALTPEALEKYGMMPEFVGRMPVLCALKELSEGELVRALTEPEDAVTKEYQLLLKQDGVDLVFEDGALREVARLAAANKTGARGLRAILEGIMVDIMYMVPGQGVSECIITAEGIRTKTPVLKKDGRLLEAPGG